MVGLHVLALVATTGAVWLGLWQYDAWQTRRDGQAADLAYDSPILLARVMSSDDPFPGDAIGRPVDFRGQWVPRSTFLVADRRQGGGTGFWVVTPVAVCRTTCAPDNPAMLVVRGWTAQPQPVPAAPHGAVHITGWLQPPEGSGRVDPDPSDKVLHEVRIADALQHVDQDLYGAYTISDDATAGLTQVTPASLPEPETFTAVRNLLYALEWWVFGGFALFLWWRWCYDQTKGSGSPRPAGVTADQDAENAEVASSP